MFVQKKAIRAQMSLYSIFALLGVFIIAKNYIDSKWFLWGGLGVFIILTIISYIVYKKGNDDVSPVNDKELKYNQYVLYTYMAVYLGAVLAENFKNAPLDIIAWGFGIVLIILAAIGFIINLRIYLRKLK